MKNIKIEEYKSITDILNSVEHMDNDTLKSTLAYLIKIYILDKEISYQDEVSDNINANISLPEQNNQITKNYSGFTEMIKDLKKKYNFSELNKFSTDNKKTFFNIDGRKILISSTQAKQNISNNQQSTANKQTPAIKPATTPQPNTGSGSGRFNNLERE